MAARCDLGREHAHDYVQKGQFSHALTEIQRVFIIDPGNSSARDFEQKIHKLLGMTQSGEGSEGAGGAVIRKDSNLWLVVAAALEEAVEPDLPEAFRLGTLISDDPRGFSATFHSPTGVGFVPDRYDNDSYSVSGVYFLPTSAAGIHEIHSGYEHFSESAQRNGHTSGSDFWIQRSFSIMRGTTLFPVLRPGQAQIVWFPFLQASRGSELVTNSGFLEDRLQLGRHWSFNLGVRYDRNRDRDSSGKLVVDSGEWSPRLSFRLDERRCSGKSFMIPWELVDSAPVPESGTALYLYRRGAEFSIRVETRELMNSRVHGSEDALAELAQGRIPEIKGDKLHWH